MNIVQSHFLCEFNQVKHVYENYQCNAVILETIAKLSQRCSFFQICLHHKDIYDICTINNYFHDNCENITFTLCTPETNLSDPTTIDIHIKVLLDTTDIEKKSLKTY